MILIKSELVINKTKKAVIIQLNLLKQSLKSFYIYKKSG